MLISGISISGIRETGNLNDAMIPSTMKAIVHIETAIGRLRKNSTIIFYFCDKNRIPVFRTVCKRYSMALAFINIAFIFCSSFVFPEEVIVRRVFPVFVFSISGKPESRGIFWLFPISRRELPFRESMFPLPP